MRDQNIYTHEDDEGFLARLPPEIVEEVRNSPLGYAWPVDDQFPGSSMSCTVGGRAERAIPDHPRSRLDTGMLRTSCTGSATSGRRVRNDPSPPMPSRPRSELMWTVENVGPSGMRRLANLGVLGEDVTLSHFVWATDEDIRHRCRHRSSAGALSGSNLRSSAGICRVRDILDAGGKVSIGTDGISSGDREDFIREVRLAGYLQREPNDVADHRIPSETLLRSATESGAGPGGLRGVVGTLAPNYQADLVSVAHDRIGFPPARYATTPELDLLVERADATDIEFVMVGGTKVVEDGEALLINEDRITDRINRAFRRAVQAHVRSPAPRELAGIMNTYVEELCRRWYTIPVERPASIMNTRSVPGA